MAHPFGSQKVRECCGCPVIGTKDERLQAPGRIVSGQARSGSRASNRSGRALALFGCPNHSRLASTDACPAFVLARRQDYISFSCDKRRLAVIAASKVDYSSRTFDKRQVTGKEQRPYAFSSPIAEHHGYRRCSRGQLGGASRVR